MKASHKNILHIVDDIPVHFANCRDKARDTGVGVSPTGTPKAVTDFLSLRRSD
ncbi:MAG: hypothetical protein U0X91_22885 [Spirosomataceae bacterium]